MEYLSEKVAYLKGLAEGMSIDENTNEGKLLKSIINVLGDFADVIDDLEDSQIQLNEHLEDMDEDLAQLEYEMYDDYDGDDQEDGDDIAYYEIECPNCNETVYMDEEMLDDEDNLACPSCKEPIEIEFECDCGCKHEEA